jgi:hypothetical protein
VRRPATIFNVADDYNDARLYNALGTLYQRNTPIAGSPDRNGTGRSARRGPLLPRARSLKYHREPRIAR